MDIESIQKTLSEKEKQMDVVLFEGRTTVRACSNSIKAMHAKELDAAKKYLSEAEEGIKKVSGYSEKFPAQINHVMQEYAEARIVLSIIEERKIPGQKELGVSDISYLLGLLDTVGELKREMFESLRAGKKEDAEFYFAKMEEIYDGLLPLRFSNAILPEFRRKQDAARNSIEHARGQLL
jgi:translin